MRVQKMKNIYARTVLSKIVKWPIFLSEVYMLTIFLLSLFSKIIF